MRQFRQLGHGAGVHVYMSMTSRAKPRGEEGRQKRRDGTFGYSQRKIKNPKNAMYRIQTDSSSGLVVA